MRLGPARIIATIEIEPCPLSGRAGAVAQM
jgi:hypothetical protein